MHQYLGTSLGNKSLNEFLIGFSKPGGCLYADRVLRTRSQTQ
jgi:hypothetical protein